MSCAVCTCTHHAVLHDTPPDPDPPAEPSWPGREVAAEDIGACEVKGCECEKYVSLDQTAWAKQPRTARHVTPRTP